MTPGAQFGDYDLIRKIGTGNMGTVWLAQRRETGQQVAIKLVRGGTSTEDRERIEVEKSGAEMQKEIADKDSRVVAVNRILMCDGYLVIEMEFVPGDDVSKAIKSSQMLPDRAAKVAMEICQMLDNLGQIVHGDLKPRNVLLPPDRVKVIDFGIAQRVTQIGGKFNPFQSVPYSSPERLKTGMVSRQTDLWSVGVMLYEMVLRVHPFASGGNDVRARVLDGRGPDAFPAMPDYPSSLTKIILKSLANSPEQRYPDARSMAEDLRRFLAGERVEASEFDPAGTRRTGPAQNPNETVRTGRAAAQSSNPAAATRVSSVVPAIWSRWAKRGVAIAAVLLLASWLYGKYRIWNSAVLLKEALATDRIDPDTAWKEVDKTGRAESLPVRLSGLREELGRRLMEAGEVPIVDYRRDNPTAREGDWERAGERFHHVLELDPGNKVAQADLSLCEGHVLRIRSRRVVKGKPEYDKVTQRDAIDHMERAARLKPDSFDPYLGLARIYFYDAHDLDKGSEMLDRAAHLGHPVGKREKLMRADGLRARGARNQEAARTFWGTPREREILEGARQDFRSAADTYSALIDFSSNIRSVIKDCDRHTAKIDKRLRQLQSNVAVGTQGQGSEGARL
jgi:predicted Ser/Thr protein kinase